MLIKSVFELENNSMSFENSSEEIGDDFSTMFSSLYLKIVTGILFLGVIPLHSVAGIFLVDFEKYGMDPMKRSIINIISSTQIYYAAVLSNIVFWPFLTWRVIVGPIQPDLSGKCHLCLIFCNQGFIILEPKSSPCFMIPAGPLSSCAAYWA